MYVIGLTGGIGSGKNAASHYFQDCGIEIVDADIAARRVVEPHTDAYMQIIDYFGVGVLLPSNDLNRSALRAQVFADPEKRQWLEDLLHPLIYQWMDQRLRTVQSPYVILASPLLLDTDQHKLVDRILVIDATEELQIERACARDATSEAQIRAIMASQLSREKRLERADDVICNSGSLEKLEQQVKDTHQKYLQLAAEAQQTA
ncbi:dephospho-CoA kinase [Porticoccus sp. W117]|uniref:dephospho-CoA kinase n=1 Tax=Porticoccus sp. W117 TaxID=3054777 RepID=UPI0025944BF6|nr:dephospho-CoA kinase [Porticoccus sp. W117]MDM3871767.1 dephospho-CoA kinase [Porticoccus sp. W117]